MVAGNETLFVWEDLLAYEFGYRQKLSEKVSLDVTGFYNDYQNLRTLEKGSSSFPSDTMRSELIIENKGFQKPMG